MDVDPADPCTLDARRTCREPALGTEQLEPVGEPATAELVQSWVESWPGAPEASPQGRCRFELSPPRHFLYPALLLLLTEEPRHGYLLGEALASLGLGRMDRPSVYRALAALERDGLVHSWDAAPRAGSTRHVHAVTPKGEQALEAWMSIVSQERNSLDQVLERYWYCNVRRPEATGSGDADGGGAEPVPAGSGQVPVGHSARFDISAHRSSLMVEARSSVGPIAFSSSGLVGWIDVELHHGLVTRDSDPSAHLEVPVSGLTSGNPTYDRELLRRLDSRSYPVVSVELQNLQHIGNGNCYRIAGDVTLHGVTQRLDGVLTATVHERRRCSVTGPEQFDCRIIVAGEQVLDIRQFGLVLPNMQLVKLYPDVRLRLHLEADQQTQQPALEPLRLSP